MYLDPVAWTTGGAVQSVDTFKIPVPGFFHPLKVVSRTGEQGGVAQAGRHLRGDSNCGSQTGLFLF